MQSSAPSHLSMSVSRALAVASSAVAKSADAAALDATFGGTMTVKFGFHVIRSDVTVASGIFACSSTVGDWAWWLLSEPSWRSDDARGAASAALPAAERESLESLASPRAPCPGRLSWERLSLAAR